MASIALRYLAVMALASVAFFSSAEAMRNFNKRSDLVNIPPLSNSGYTVPLQGSETCTTTSTICSDTLPAPLPQKSLKALALARGVLTYDCMNVAPTDLPVFVSQNTQLYDVAPLVSILPNEDALHELVPEFYDYDYTELENSTLVCIGGIYTEHGGPFVVLNNVDTFPIRIEQSIKPPDNSDLFNAYWAHSVSLDDAWDVYRVETFGGGVPLSCAGQNSTMEEGYAAEYWFYHV